MIASSFELTSTRGVSGEVGDGQIKMPLLMEPEWRVRTPVAVAREAVGRCWKHQSEPGVALLRASSLDCPPAAMRPMPEAMTDGENLSGVYSGGAEA